MALYGSAAEYALHCVLYLVSPPPSGSPSARDVAEFQGVSPSLVAKLFTSLQKAGLIEAQEGVRGGFRLARPAEQISVLEVVDAAEGPKQLFDCKEIRANCALFADGAPPWATNGLCTIHATMRRAESAMRDELSRVTIADLAVRVVGKATPGFGRQTVEWFAARARARTGRSRRAGNGGAPCAD